MKAEKKRVYRETMDDILAQKHISRIKFSEAIGRSHAYYTTIFRKGYSDISIPQLRLWALTLNVSEDTITAIPVSSGMMVKSDAPAASPANTATKEQVEELHAMLVDGFAMLHQDLQILVETMHRYWKPEEPKYEIREREQE